MYGETRQSMEAMFDLARENISWAQKHEKQLYDRKVHGSGYNENDLVWLLNPSVKVGRTNKLNKP
jgi:hypothetical protein